MRPIVRGFFAIPVIIVFSIVMFGQTTPDPNYDLHTRPRPKRADEIIKSLSKSCDEGDRLGRIGEFEKAETAWKTCFDGLKSFIDSDQETPVTREYLEQYLSSRETQSDKIKARRAEIDSAVQSTLEECAKGDEFWQQRLYSTAQIHWNNCLSGFAEQVGKLRDDPDGSARIKSLIEERNKIQKQKLDELLESRRQKEEELARLDREEIAANPPKRLRSGAVPIVLAHLNEFLNDPKSLQIVRWGEPILVQGTKTISGKGGSFYPWYWVVTVRYRARNPFNGLMLVEEDYYIRNNRIVKVEKR